MNLEILCTPYTKDVEQWLKEHIDFYSGKKVLHIVPTLILYRRRLQFYKITYMDQFDDIQNDIDQIAQRLRKNYIGLYEMDQFLLELIKSSDLPVLSKRESTVIIERILQKHSFSNNIAWKSAIPDISDCFLTLSQTGLSIEEIRNLDFTKSWQSICDLYEHYLQELSQNNMMDYGQASVRLLQEYNFNDIDMLLLDGAFLPILPKHQILINRFQSLNKKIKCFLPVDLDQEKHPAFEAIKTTYSNFTPVSEWISIKSERIAHNVVQKLSKSIFYSKIEEIDDRSVQIGRFTSEEEELDRVVERITRLIQQRAAKANKIAIITPNPMELRPVVREIAEIYGLAMEVPERSLIQLPHGRAISNLFKIYTDDRIEALDLDHIFDFNMLFELLDSGLIKNSEELLNPVTKLQSFFEDCKLFSDWFDKIEQLIIAKDQLTEDLTSHPLYYISKDILYNLKNTINVIQKISTDLFSVQDMTFRDHMAHLIDYFQKSPYTNEIEKEISERLSHIANELSIHQHLLISRYEFARRIHTILNDKQYETLEKGTIQPEKILVTGPNNVEFQQYDYIFLTRFTQNMYPESITYKWPFTINIERKILNKTTVQNFANDTSLLHYYLDRSIYHFYTALSAAERAIYISYPRFDNGIELSPSHYLYDIAKAFGIEESDENTKETIEDLLMAADLLFEGSSDSDDKTLKLSNPSLSPLKENEIITIEDIAIYQFCPRRFYYEKSLSHEYVYSSMFHIQNYAVSCLYEKAVINLVNKFPNVSMENVEKIKRSLPEIIGEAETEIGTLFPIGQRYWEDVKMRTEFHLLSLLDRILSQTDHKQAKLSIKSQQHSMKIGNYIFSGERQLQVTYPTITHYYSIKNMKKILSFYSNDTYEEQQRLKDIKNNYFNLLSNFCRKEKVAEQSLSYYAEKIASGDFPKTPRAHCRYCSFENACKEKRSQQK